MSIYDIQVSQTNGEMTDLSKYRDKVLLIVNTASKCGLTPQFEGLQKLYDDYHDKGLEILGFPCNQFAGQDPGSQEEIVQFCQLNYGVSFDMYEKIDVNGINTAPLFEYLKKQKGGLLSSAIKWNFTKFLVDRQGNVVERYAPQTEPAKLAADIEKQLAVN